MIPQTPHRQWCALDKCYQLTDGGLVLEKRTKSGNKLFETSCAVCGNPTWKTKAQIEKYNVVCSKACNVELRRRKWIGNQNPNYKGMIETHCANCNHPLKRYPCHARDYEKHFCNARCFGEWRTKNDIMTGEKNPLWKGGSVTVICATCGKDLQREINQIERNTNNFCDSICYGLYLSEHRAGENSPTWKGGYDPYYGPGWNRQRKKALERDNYTCQHCGDTEEVKGRRPDVHHIQPFRTFSYVKGENDNHRKANHLSNLICLCTQCHKQAEHGQIAIQPRLIQEHPL